MDCCSTSSYVDYRHRSMNGNFCYPYAPSMLRSASPYPLAATSRYGSDYRSSPLGYHHAGGHAGPGAYDGGSYEKYYGGGYHHAPSGYQSGYYGNYPSAYRDYGGYGHYYGHQAQSPYARGSSSLGPGASPYSGGSPNGGYLYAGGRHYPAPAFGSREAYYHQHNAAQRDHHQQYPNFTGYSHLHQPSPYRHGVGPAQEHSGGKSHHHHPGQQQHQQQYPPQPSFTGSHNERGMTGSVGSDGSSTSTGHPSPSSASLYGAPNGYPSPSSEYTNTTGGGGGLPASSASYSSQADSPQHHDAAKERDAPTPTTPLLGGGATEGLPHGTKDARMRKPKERKLHRGSRTSSPSGAATVNNERTVGGGGGGPAQRMKSLDALTNLCWPEEDQFPGRARKYSTANGLKSKEAANGRKESNELEATGTASPGRAGSGPGRRTKKQTPGSNKQSKEATRANESREKQTNGGTATNPPATTAPSMENKHITPLPGFQQAFGSTEIGKFSEVFFNSSPTSSDHSPPDHHHHHHHHHPLQLQEQHQSQSQSQIPAQTLHGTTMQQLVMESLNAYESDVDTLSPQPWDPAPGEPYDSGGGGGTGYNLQIGTTFHPSYYESSSYSDHAVDSPLGNYFSEMTCSEFVN
uniref:Uncharacterized protein n=1 Tax=Anopheles farauti TaxID=69004 RepID=A0A182QZ73_9DIPT